METGAAPVVVNAVPLEMSQPAQVPMQTVVPDGVAPGGQFMITTPSGMQMMVTCPVESKSGDAIQIMVPAGPSAPMAVIPMGPPPSHPAARNVNGAVCSLQGCCLSLPQPIRRCGKSTGSPANPDALTAHFNTENPHADAATLLAGIETADPFAGLLSGGPTLSLDNDVEGRVADVVSNLNKSCACYLGMLILCPIPCCCVIPCRAGDTTPCGQAPLVTTSFGENQTTARLRVSAAAHKLTLHSDCIVYERVAHEADVMKNYVAMDQYGHRYPACALKKRCQIPAMRLSIPIARASVAVLPRKTIIQGPPGYDEAAIGCCDYTPQGDVVTVSVGDGLKVVVACVEVGSASNAPAFADACKRAREGAPAEPPELVAAFNAWFLQRVRQSGTMTGCGPQPSEMERASSAWPASTGGRTAQFVKTVGPLPPQLGIQKNSWSTNRVGALGGIEVMKATGQIFSPHHSPFVDQMNAGDVVLSLNGVRRTGAADHAWLDQVAAASQSGPAAYPYADVMSTMPYFQPSHLVSVTIMSAADLGLDAGAGKPPQCVQPNASLGLFPADLVVQATVHGVAVDTTGMTSGELLALLQPLPGPIAVTLLQASRIGALSHTHSWPMNFGR